MVPVTVVVRWRLWRHAGAVRAPAGPATVPLLLLLLLVLLLVLLLLVVLLVWVRVVVRRLWDEGESERGRQSGHPPLLQPVAPQVQLEALARSAAVGGGGTWSVGRTVLL
jgi:uncharacterized membrane protein YhaH (DUF805 family)